MAQDSPYYSAEEAASRLGVSRETIYDWCKDGTLKDARQFGKTWRIPKTSVDPQPSQPTSDEKS